VIEACSRYVGPSETASTRLPRRVRNVGSSVGHVFWLPGGSKVSVCPAPEQNEGAVLGHPPLICHDMTTHSIFVAFFWA
jgi:hypothetical protein